MDNRWQFWIDVGGTFTDCLAQSPDGNEQVTKVLSSGVVKGNGVRASNNSFTIFGSRTDLRVF
ncbi:MAG: hydantoinase/oxoprolinase N-terminal domain-containing protein, partial [Planctomycetota bacterium]